jgi:hypothetical protein
MKMLMCCRVGRAIVAGALFATACPTSVLAQLDTNPLNSVLDMAGFTAVWTAPGSTGVTESPGNIDHFDAIVRTSPSAPAGSSTFLRYPIQPIRNDNFVHACLRLGAMYRDDSAAARVIVRFKAVDLTFANTQPEVIMTIDSAAYPQSNEFQARAVTINNSWFNFDRWAYYVEVQLIKNTAAAQPAVRWVYLAAPDSSIVCP